MEIDTRIVIVFRIKVWISDVESEWICIVQHWRQLSDGRLSDLGVITEPQVLSISQIRTPHKFWQQVIVGLADICFVPAQLTGELRHLVLKSCIHSIDSVSYTHLDVYKRQTLNWWKTFVDLNTKQ